MESHAVVGRVHPNPSIDRTLEIKKKHLSITEENFKRIHKIHYMASKAMNHHLDLHHKKMNCWYNHIVWNLNDNNRYHLYIIRLFLSLKIYQLIFGEHLLDKLNIALKQYQSIELSGMMWPMENLFDKLYKTKFEQKQWMMEWIEDKWIKPIELESSWLSFQSI